MIKHLSVLILLLSLGACAEAEKKDARADRDPVAAAALADPLMGDPDLVSQSRNDSAIQGGGPPSAEVPPNTTGPDEVRRATAAATELAGGKLANLPPARALLKRSRLAGQLTPHAIAAALPELSKGCTADLQNGFVWAARLPAGIPVYPRGHARQAAGADAPGCRLRVVDYLTPVAPADVLALYATLGGKAGLKLAHRQEGEDLVLAGSGASTWFLVYARKFEPGMSQVVLVTREL